MASDQPPPNPYGTPSAAIEPTQPYLQQLRFMAHHRDVLVKNGFVVNPLSQADIDDKKRCRKCNMRCSNQKNKYKPDGRDAKRAPKKPSLDSGPSSQPKRTAVPSVVPPGAAEEDGKPRQPVLKCQYHTGRVDRMHWTCCRAHVSAPGCTWAPDHLTRTYAPGDLHTRHQYHRTPSHALLDLSPAVPGSAPRRPRAAVAIDCEMGTAFDGESELIRVTLVDYFTAEILLDSLVCPQVPMAHYNTKWSGVSRQQMNDARAKGTCITGGSAAALEAVWRWVAPDTVLVGHAVHNDLASLRWIHPTVVDSLILATAARAEREKREEEERKQRGEQGDEEQEAAAAAAAVAAAALGEDDGGDLISFAALGPGPQQGPEKPSADKARVRRKPGGLSLKALTSEMFNRQIQKGKQGHDSLEDALAARDIVHWFVMQKSAEAQGQDGGTVMPGFW